MQTLTLLLLSKLTALTDSRILLPSKETKASFIYTMVNLD